MSTGMWDDFMFDETPFDGAPIVILWGGALVENFRTVYLNLFHEKTIRISQP